MLIGLSVPAFKRTFSRLSAQDTSFNISKLMNYAQEMAVLGRKNFKISFDLQDGKYRLFEADPLVKPSGYKKAEGRFGKLFRLGQGLKFRGDRKDMVFYPDGHCDEFAVSVMTKDSGYSVHARRFGNMVEIREINVE